MRIPKNIDRILIFLARGVLFALSIGIAAWSISGGNDLGERATFMQAVLAVAILLSTWSVEDRQRNQEESVKLQIEESKNPRLAIFARLDTTNHYSSIKIEIINLSNYPVYIQNAQLQDFIDDEAIVKEINISKRSMQSGEISILDLPIDVRKIDEIFEMKLSFKERRKLLQDNYMSFLLIAVRYGGQPMMNFVYDYTIEISDNFGQRANQKKWTTTVMPYRDNKDEHTIHTVRPML